MEEISGRKTKKAIDKTINEHGWTVGKTVHRRRKYYVFYATPTGEMDDEKRLISAISAIHDVQERFVEMAKQRKMPKPAVLQFVMATVEDFAHYPFRLAVILPPWLHISPTANYIEQLDETKAKKILSRIHTHINVGGNVLSTTAFSKRDLVFKKPLEEAIASNNLPLHIATGGNIHESAGLAALLQRMDENHSPVKIAKNVYVVVPNPKRPKQLRTFGNIVTELDGLAVDGRNVHQIEVKSAGIRTAPRWENIVRRKAIALTPALEYLLQMMINHPNRLHTHFIVVANSEENATSLASTALSILKTKPKSSTYQKPHPFERLAAHAVWPHMEKILIRSMYEPIW